MTRRLVDGFGRVHTNLRISVTDRCNLRCVYCMPEDNPEFVAAEQVLSFDEIERFVRVAAGCGVSKLRLTGGEPLLRAGLAELVERLVRIEGIADVALTTNGILLVEQAEALRQAGLQRLNVSLDSLDEAIFRRISRRAGVERVLRGIRAAREAGFRRIRLNAVALRGMSEAEVIPLARFAREHALELRFIEFMPLDADGAWQPDQVLTGAQIRTLLEAEFGPLVPLAVADPSQPAVDYEFADGGGRIGLIHPVSQPFCSRCNRLRLSATGQVHNCLFSPVEWNARPLLGGGRDAQLIELLEACVGGKRAGHGIDRADFVRPERPMYQIGG